MPDKVTREDSLCASGAPATLEMLEGHRARVQLSVPQRAITPGQAAVFYDGDRVVGGGWIVRQPRSCRSMIRLVLTTFANAEDAAKAVRTLVDEQIVACGTILPGARSIYRWKDAIEDTEESVGAA